ncbi:class I SAM-dependent methyltransferase [Frankia sp. AgKG'84/4]|uniref:class I SAM-dependent methyltransferase n=1 Tax=Frankia sp. AgKG'84/4 TaxID=573490 RepID=UPI00200C213F|nr:class I SAM-dependent methyltransferase [Frankia sp. AgKG'84/4]MCL9795281.1 class I SAM-dependent methyltransferase [Frankia sp. AgKG'84/4]
MLTWLPILVCVGLILNGVRLRGRLRRLETVPVSGRPVDPDHEFLLAAGVRISDGARRAASYHASRDRLGVLDLVPADLTVERALDLARMVDTRSYRTSRTASGRGAFQALLVRSEILDRAGIDRRDDYDPVELVDVTERLKLYAADATDLVVLPGLRAARDDAAMRVRVQQRAYRFTRHYQIFPFVPQLCTAIGTQVNWRWGIAATALFWFQPFVVCAGRVPLAPRDLIRSPIVRLLGGVLFVIDSVRAGRRQSARAAQAKAAGLPADPVKHAARQRTAASREAYGNAVRAGLDRFFGRERDDCPWCGSLELATRLDSPDMLMHKPGRFRLERCRRCDHVFLNPPLSRAGHQFYERDRYDGLRAETAEQALAVIARGRRAQAAAIWPYVVPRTWLDVGCRYGHFPNAAREVWPATVFDGVDTPANLDEGLHRGWLDHGYDGRLPAVAEAVAGRYDVISMFGYLERSPDPSAELDALAKALPPGGHLLCELPNTECRQARWLGRFWSGWAVPERVNFIPVDNLLAALADRGLRPVLVRFAAPRGPGDLTGAVLLAAAAIAPRPMPWLRQAAVPVRMILWALVRVMITPLLALARVADWLTSRYAHSQKSGSTFLIIARKEV